MKTPMTRNFGSFFFIGALTLGSVSVAQADMPAKEMTNVLQQMIPYLCNAEGPLKARLPRFSVACQKLIEAVTASPESLQIDTQSRPAHLIGANGTKTPIPQAVALRLSNTISFMIAKANPDRAAVTSDTLKMALHAPRTLKSLKALQDKTYGELALADGAEKIFPETGGEAYLRQTKSGRWFLELAEIRSSSLISIQKIMACGYNWNCLRTLYESDSDGTTSCDEAGLIKAFLGRVSALEQRKGIEAAQASYRGLRATVTTTCGNSFWVNQVERLSFAMEHRHRGIYIGPWHTHPGETPEGPGDAYMSPDDLAMAEGEGRAIMIQFAGKNQFELFDANFLKTAEVE